MTSPSPSALLDALLRTTTDAIIPQTAAGVASGSKVFGAAILRKSNLSLVIAATNHETESPLLHGEINCIQQFWGLPKDQRPPPGECVFFATHEPCSLCMSFQTLEANARPEWDHVERVRQPHFSVHVRGDAGHV